MANSYGGFASAFANPSYTQRTHHQSNTTFNQNPFGMSGFGMAGTYINNLLSPHIRKLYYVYI